MARLGHHRIAPEVTTPQDGAGAREATARERHCAICGRAANTNGLAIERFGEPFCSEGHAEEFVKAVQAARVQVVSAAPSTPKLEQGVTAGQGVSTARSWKGLLKMGLCCGLPILAIAVLAGGGGVVLGAAGALLPALAMLACPLGMYFMMRSMSKTGHDDRGDKGGEKKLGPRP